MFSFWELIDQVLNRVLFGLIGLKLLTLANMKGSWAVAALLVAVVLAARFVSVCLAAVLVRRLFDKPTPHAVKILTWGGLRGGISVALALSLPAFEGDTFVTATYAVLFSLLVRAPTLGRLLGGLQLRA